MFFKFMPYFAAKFNFRDKIEPLFLRPLKLRTTGEDLANLIEEQCTRLDVDLKKVECITVDGAAANVAKKKGAATRLKAKYNKKAKIRICAAHRYSTAVKLTPVIKGHLEKFSKIVKFFKVCV